MVILIVFRLSAFQFTNNFMLILLFCKFLSKVSMLVVSYDMLTFWMWSLSMLVTFHVWVQLEVWCLNGGWWRGVGW